MSRVEITKLAAELRVPDGELAFLGDRSPEELRDLRAMVSRARFARHEQRSKTIAALSRRLPASLSAKIARSALGPMLSAHVASAMKADDAARLAGHLDPSFLADLAPGLDPTRVGPLLRRLPDTLVIEVATLLVERKDYITLGRLVSTVDTPVALRVIEQGDEEDLLHVALFAEDRDAIDAIARQLPDEQLAEVIATCARADLYDGLVALLRSLSRESATRLIAQVVAVEDNARESVIEAIAQHDAWPVILPSLAELAEPTLARIVSSPTVLDPVVADRVIEHARRLDLPEALVRSAAVLDDEHVEALRGSQSLRDRDLQDWMLSSSPEAPAAVLPILTRLGLR